MNSFLKKSFFLANYTLEYFPVIKMHIFLQDFINYNMEETLEVKYLPFVKKNEGIFKNDTETLQ